MATDYRNYALSPIQQDILARDGHGGTDRSIEQFVCILREAIEISVFEKAWSLVAATHRSLRAYISENGVDAPSLRVAESVATAFVHDDWGAHSKRERSHKLKTYLRADRKKGFDLTSGPLYRVALIRQATKQFVCIWTYHNILLDSRSATLVLKDVFATYEALRRNQEPIVEQREAMEQYATWQRRQDTAKAKSFWCNRLEALAPSSGFMVDRPANPAGGDGGQHGSKECWVDQETTAKLLSLAQREDIELRTIVEGCWAIFLGRYAGEEDIVFGVTRTIGPAAVVTSNPAIGTFTNTLPLRVRFVPGASLVPCLKKLHADSLAIVEHGHVSLAMLREINNIEADVPLFKSVVAVEDRTPNAALRNAGSPGEQRSFHLLRQSGYPITITAYQGAQLLLHVAYDRARLDDATAERILEHLTTLLKGIAADPDQPLTHLPLLSDSERHQLVVGWNATAVAYDRNRCIHSVFEDQVAKTPDAVALICGQERLTYRQLNRRSNQLARYLMALGVGPDVAVGVYLERDADLVVGLLGVLKAGGAYVPLDPAFPSHRIAFVLNDASVPVVLTTAALAKDVSADGVRHVLLDKAGDVVAEQGSENVDSGAGPNNLSYLIYTSGSTGKPKGVMVRHRNVMNFFVGMDQTVGAEPPGVWLAVTSHAFDISVLELFWTLGRGFSVVLHGEDRACAFADPIKRHQVTHMQCTPSMASIMIQDHKVRAAMARLRTFVVGGEALPPALADQVKQSVQGRVINMYGPTETTVWSTSHELDAQERDVPIGRPLANQQVYILDHNLHLVPIGVAGELVIGGDGVTAGYLGRHDLTAEKFVANPFSDDPESRLYRTGDRARYGPDGTIAFLGRFDHQVKIRGYRIELGEIEAALGAHPNVKEAVVMARDQGSDDVRLVAYLVLKRNTARISDELRQFLERDLPNYMIPTDFVQLDAFPLTPNGKIDRKAFPAPVEVSADKGIAIEPPKADAERILIGIWQQRLKREHIGRRDNFFAVGGHSLLAIQVILAIRESFDIDLPLISLYQAPTVRELAQTVRQAQREQAASGVRVANRVAPGRSMSDGRTAPAGGEQMRSVPT